jgi:Cof subfamily protein (haloacid dehalogenase superfamily)
MKMIKLFVSDIDGTLFDSTKSKKISERNISAVQKMVAAGITVTIATGRMYRAALPIAKELGVNVPIITYNGALIKSVEGEILHSEYLPTDLITEIVNFFEKKNWYLQSYSNDELAYAFRNNFTELYETTQKVQGKEVGWQGLRERTNSVCKLLGINANLAETLERVKLVKEEFGEKIAVTKSHPQFIEMMMPGVSKAAAIKILAEKLGVDKSEVMAIGDSDNDLPMLQAAGQSVAMGNATDEIKSACTFVTSNCEDDGFADAVEKFVFG